MVTETDFDSRTNDGDNRKATIGSNSPSLSSTLSIDDASSRDSHGARPVDGWPRQPRRLERNWQSLAVLLFLDVTFALASMAFLAYGLVVLSYRGRPLDENARMAHTLAGFAALGPTLSPILFAAVVGRAIKTLLVWLLERGATLGLLDLLAGSNTIAGAFWSLYVIRTTWVPGIGLVCVWALSPVGGQASLRVVDTDTMTKVGVDHIEYMSFDHSFENCSAMGEMGTVGPVVSNLFNAAVLASARVKGSPVDSWNNVKIPRLSNVNDVPFDSDGWQHLPDARTSPLEYASLVGVPVEGLRQNANKTFTVETFYWDLDCTDLMDRAISPPGSELIVSNVSHVSNHWSGDWWGAGNSLDYMLTNTTKQDNPPDGACIDLRSSSDPELKPRHIWYTSFAPDEHRFASLCTMRTVYVEVHIECDLSGDCWPSMMRRSALTRPAQDWTILDALSELRGCDFFEWFMQYFLMYSAPQQTHGAAMSPVKGYLWWPDAPAVPIFSTTVSDANAEAFGLRLSQLLNSLWQIFAGPYALVYGLAEDEQFPVKDGAKSFKASRVDATATVYEHVQVIACRVTWLVWLLIASSFLLATCLLSMILRVRWNAIELSLNISSMTRDNPYVVTPAGGSHLDGDERARLLRRHKVMLGDVAPKEDIGHLAIASGSRFAGSNGVSEARRTRLYD